MLHHEKASEDPLAGSHRTQSQSHGCDDERQPKWKGLRRARRCARLSDQTQSRWLIVLATEPTVG